MEEQNKSREHIFQGGMYLLQPEKSIFLYGLSLTDPVEPELLQKALDRTLSKMDYFRLSLCGDEKDPYHVQNDRPCLVYPEGEKRKIPEETNGYLFYVTYKDCSVYLHCWHFLTDGRGAFFFASQLIKEYCVLRYHIDYADTPFPKETPLTWEEMEPYYQPYVKGDGLLDAEIFQQESRGIMMRVDKSSVIALAKEKGAKPFCCLLALLSLAAQRSLGKEEFAIEYTVNARPAVGHPEALYNCSAMFTDIVSPGRGQTFDQMIGHIAEGVKRNLLPETVRDKLSQLLGFIREIYKLSAPLSVKKRVYQMAQGEVPAFTLSFCGSLPLGDAPGIERYLTDFYILLPVRETPMLVAVTDLGGQWNFGIEHRYPNDDLPEILRSVMEEHNIKVNEIRAIE